MASPSSSIMPPLNLKRPRTSNVAAPTAGPASRAKRRKPEEVNLEAGLSNGSKGAVNFGVGMVKGREDEYGEPADVHTMIDFNTLPVETLYKYLELHDLLPRWDVSPWSEDPCTPPNSLYTIPPAPPPVPIVPSPKNGATSLSPSQRDPSPAEPFSDLREHLLNTSHEIANPIQNEQDLMLAPDASIAEDAQMDDESPAPPTTRSKTAPHRKTATPAISSPSPPPEVRRGVITLSDVLAAREVLSEKANAHWMKGLGGGQNKEGETIVNFLYKMKTGPGRLLRVYNPYPAPYP